MAAWVIVQEAQRILRDELEGASDQDDLETFIDAYFEDLDFEFLYDNAYDGIDETEVAEKLGISSLAFDDWFQPFSDEPERIPHPYVS